MLRTIFKPTNQFTFCGQNPTGSFFDEHGGLQKSCHTAALIVRHTHTHTHTHSYYIYNQVIGSINSSTALLWTFSHQHMWLKIGETIYFFWWNVCDDRPWNSRISCFRLFSSMPICRKQAVDILAASKAYHAWEHRAGLGALNCWEAIRIPKNPSGSNSLSRHQTSPSRSQLQKHSGK